MRSSSDCAPSGAPSSTSNNPFRVCEYMKAHLALDGQQEAGEKQQRLRAQRRPQQRRAQVVQQVRGERQAGQPQAAPEARQPLLLQQEGLRGRAGAVPPDARLNLRMAWRLRLPCTAKNPPSQDKGHWSHPAQALCLHSICQSPGTRV